MKPPSIKTATNQAEMGLGWGGLASTPTCITEKQQLLSAARLRALGISAAC